MRKWMKSPAGRAIGYTLSAVLMVGSIWYAFQGVKFSELKNISPWAIVVLALLVTGSIIATSAIFQVVTKSFDHKPTLTMGWMTALVALSTLLNYVPFIRAGLFGRTAYLKTKFGVSVRDSVLTLGVIAITTVGVLVVISVMGLTGSPGLFWSVSLVLLLLMTVVCPVVFKQMVGRPAYWGLTWVPLRVVDIAMTTARMWLVFNALGHPITVEQAVVIGSASLIVKLSGVTPNGLGLSEIVVGALAAAMSEIDTDTAIAAALVDRAVEVVVSVVAGLISAAAVSRLK